MFHWHKWLFRSVHKGYAATADSSVHAPATRGDPCAISQASMAAAKTLYAANK